MADETRRGDADQMMAARGLRVGSKWGNRRILKFYRDSTYGKSRIMARVECTDCGAVSDVHPYGAQKKCPCVQRGEHRSAQAGDDSMVLRGYHEHDDLRQAMVRGIVESYGGPTARRTQAEQEQMEELLIWVASRMGGLTQYEIAWAYGVSHQAISYAEQRAIEKIRRIDSRWRMGLEEQWRDVERRDPDTWDSIMLGRGYG